MPRIEFEADTIEELVAMARRWIAAEPDVGLTYPAHGHPAPVKTEDLVSVLQRIKSERSRDLLRDVAACSLSGEAYVQDEGAQVGVLGVINRTMRRRAHRALLTWDAGARGYHMDPDDARVVHEVVGSSRAPEAGQP